MFYQDPASNSGSGASSHFAQALSIGRPNIAQMLALSGGSGGDDNNQHSELNGNSTNAPMSINDHLSSMPMPWIDFRMQRQNDSQMLNLGGGLGPPPPVSSSTNESAENKKIRNATGDEINANHTSLRGNGELNGNRNGSPDGSAANNSSSSCSPATPQEMAQVIAANRMLQHHTEELASADLDRVVGSTLSDMMKTEPALDLDYMQMMQSRLAAHHVVDQTMQPMPLHLFPVSAFGRSSQGNERHQSAESCPAPAPAPARRTRSANDGMLKCQFCPKKFLNERTLHLHMADCRLIRTHECAQCGKRFKARGGLQQHVRIHSNDKAYSCQFCSKRFTQKSHLDQHERIHTGAKPFICQFCGRAFRQRSQQLGHESTHSSSHSNNTTTATSSGSSSSTGQRSEDVSRTSPSPRHAVNQQLNVAAAAMMQQHHISSSDLLGHLEQQQNRDQLLALSSHHHSSISSLLALHNPDVISQQHHQLSHHLQIPQPQQQQQQHDDLSSPPSSLASGFLLNQLH